MTNHILKELAIDGKTDDYFFHHFSSVPSIDNNDFRLLLRATDFESFVKGFDEYGKVIFKTNKIFLKGKQFFVDDTEKKIFSEFSKICRDIHKYDVYALNKRRDVFKNINKHIAKFHDSDFLKPDDGSYILPYLPKGHEENKDIIEIKCFFCLFHSINFLTDTEDDFFSLPMNYESKSDNEKEDICRIFFNIRESLEKVLWKKLYNSDNKYKDKQHIQINFTDAKNADFFLCLTDSYPFQRDSNIIDKFADKFIKAIGSKQNEDKFKPIIFIAAIDIMALTKRPYYESIKKNIENNNEIKIFDSYPERKLGFDTRYRFFDSNIWFRYIPITRDIFKDFEEALNALHKCKENKIYESVVASEYLEFQMRMLRNSYIKSVVSLEDGAHHASQITPFKFHSEKKLKFLANQKEESLFGDSNPLEWRIMLLDDYSKKGLKLININKEDLGLGVAKEEIVNSLIQYRKESQGVEIVNVETINKAEELLKKDKIHDIILLDNLIEKTDININLIDYEYGYEFIEKLKEDEEKENEEFDRGPLRKFFIFPISVYPNALRDRLQDLGINLSSFSWEISLGADPINTPHLFRYKLYEMMRHQLEGLIRLEGPIEAEKRESYLIYHLKELFIDEYVITRENAQKVYPNVVELGARFKNLLRYKSRSKFAKSMIKQYFFDLDQPTWNHLQNLIHLLTYGTFQEKTQMWEEATFIIRFLSLQQDESELRKCPFYNAIMRIRNYVASLNTSSKMT